MRNLNKSKVFKVGFFVCSMVILVVLYSFGMNLVKKDRMLNKESSLDYSVLFSVEECKEEKNALQLSGWALRLNAKQNLAGLVFKPTNAVAETLTKPAKRTERSEINDYFQLDSRAGKTGFKVTIGAEEYEQDVCYELFFYLKYQMQTGAENSGFLTEKTSSVMVAANKYMYNGKIYDYNPINYKTPEIENETLLNVINNGVLRMYNEEDKLWIYQYDNQLYYFTNMQDTSLRTSKKGFTVMLQTAKKEKLPSNRVQYGFDHLGVRYENREFSDIWPYQVVIVPLSDQYPISYLTTGLYDMEADAWITRYEIPFMETNK